MKFFLIVIPCLVLIGCADEVHHASGATTCTAISVLGSAPSPICYDVVDGRSVFQGDIVLNQVAPEHELPIGALISRQDYRKVYSWPSTTIAYTIDPALPNQERVHGAIAVYASQTAIRLVPRTTQVDYITFRRRAGIACYSNIGRVGGQQFIDLDDSCTQGNTVHEIGHAMGLWHEQSRSDRDSYVNILTQNMKPGFDSAFEKNPTYSESYGTYDFDSVMHYHPYSFSANGQPTITRKDGRTDFGNRNDLSTGDRQALAALFGAGNPNQGNTLGAGHAFAAAPASGAGIVQVWDSASGSAIAAYNPFPGFTGGMSLAMGDIDADGALDTIVSVAGQGPPLVVAYSGRTGGLIRSFYAFPASFTGGVSLASGDVNGDGADDIVAGIASNGPAAVQVFDGRSGGVIALMLVYPSNYTGGIRVAAGDTTGDGRAEVITMPGTGLPSDTRIYNLAVSSTDPGMQFFAVDAAFTGGFHLAAGDLNGDGRADIVQGIRSGFAPYFVARDGANPNGVIATVLAFPLPSYTGGIHVAATRFGGQPGIVVGTGATLVPYVRVMSSGGGVLWEKFIASTPTGGAVVAGR